MTAEGPPVWLLEATDDPTSVPLPAEWTGRDGLDLAGEPWDLADRRWVAVGRVVDDATARAAAEAVARGVGLAAAVDLPAPVRHRLLEDLEKLGARVQASRDPAALEGPSVSAEAASLLDHLAAGATVTDAATATHRSRRTANRLLAEARAAVGVESTAQLVGWWVEVGQASSRS